MFVHDLNLFEVSDEIMKIMWESEMELFKLILLTDRIAKKSNT